MKQKTSLLSALCVGICLWAMPAMSAPDADGASESPSEPATEGQGKTAVEQFCTNVRDAAADARLAWQAESLRELEKQIEQRIAELNAKQSEYEDWLQRREELLGKARENIVAVYARMRPDAAALQLATLDDEVAASVLANLTPRAAGAILNEMAAERAAQLALAMSGPPASSGEEAPK